MKVAYYKRFTKNFKKRIAPDHRLDQKFQERLTLFLNDPNNPVLKDHKLEGNMEGLRSFWVTGDIRVTYSLEGDIVKLYDIGSHNQVY